MFEGKWHFNRSNFQDEREFPIGSAKFYRRSHRAVIRVYDEAGNVTETHRHIGDFKEP